MGRFYRHIFDHRLKGDYGTLVKFEPDDVQRWQQQAVELVAEVTRLVEQRPGDRKQPS